MEETTKYTNRTLCSVWDWVHFTAIQRMTATDIAKRFGVSRETAERWREVAIELGVEVSEVKTPTGIAYRTDRAQGWGVLEEVFDEKERAQKEATSSRKKRYKAKAKA